MKKTRRREDVTLSLRIGLLFLLSLGVLIVVVYSVMSEKFQDTLKDYSLVLMQSMTSQGVGLIDKELKNSLREAVSLSWDVSKETLRPDSPSQCAFFARHHLPEDGLRLLLIDTEGRFYASDNTTGDIGGRRDVSAALAGKAEIFGPYFTSGGAFLISYTAPVHCDGRLVGAVSVEKDAYVFSRIIKDIKFLSTGASYLLNGEGTDIAVSDPQHMVWVTQQYNARRLVKEDPSLQDIVDLEQRGLDGETGVGTYIWDNGVVYLAYEPLRMQPWVFLVGVRQEELKTITKNALKTASLESRELKIAAGAFVCLTALIICQILTGTRRATLRVELERARKEAQRKSGFLSRMSHEIRTPMNGIIGMAEIMKANPSLNAQAKENLAKMHAASQYLLSLINDILDTSKLESGKVVLACEPFDLRNCVMQLEHIIAPLAENKGVCFGCDVDVAHAQICGDAVRLKQILLNLLSNAVKFTGSGGTVQLTIHELAPAGARRARVFFSVRDSGIGIASGDLRHIFDIFTQVGKNKTSAYGGSGLGLAICNSLVTLMGGDLYIDSRENEGSVFFFELTFPLAEDMPGSAETGDESRNEVIAGLRVLLAEDDEINAEIAVALLDMQGAAADRATDGREVVEMFAARPAGHYDAILMDIQMPIKNGLDAAREIRGLPHADAADIPIIAMTANTFQEDVDSALAAGMNGFLAKPVDVRLLCRTLRAAVDERTRKMS